MASQRDMLGFDGQVVVVTGGGSGIGRATAIELARRGARLVVNDIGVTAGGGTARAVVDEIEAAGGAAVACEDSVATIAGGNAPIAAALDTWGRLDAVIAAAGNMAPAEFVDTPLESFRDLFDVHVGGVVSIMQPAFRHMRAHGGGRMVIVSSGAGMFGGLGHANYGSVKAAQIGLMHTIANEGAAHGIRCNVIMPWARGTMLGAQVAESPIWKGKAAAASFDPSFLADLTPARVAALMVVLTHQSCVANNQIFLAYGRCYARLWTAFNAGWIAGEDGSAEAILAHFDVVESGPGQEHGGDTVAFNIRMQDHILAHK